MLLVRASALDIHFSEEPAVTKTLDLTCPLYVMESDIQRVGEVQGRGNNRLSLKCVSSASSEAHNGEEEGVLLALTFRFFAFAGCGVPSSIWGTHTKCSTDPLWSILCQLDGKVTLTFIAWLG